MGIVEATLGRWVAKARENGEAREPELDVSERAALQVRYGKRTKGSPPRRRAVLSVMPWAVEVVED